MKKEAIYFPLKEGYFYKIGEIEYSLEKDIINKESVFKIIHPCYVMKGKKVEILKTGDYWAYDPYGEVEYYSNTLEDLLSDYQQVNGILFARFIHLKEKDNNDI